MSPAARNTIAHNINASIPAAILDTVLGHLALIFLTATGNDLSAARDAANQMLAAYHPQTPDELNLAAEIISFSVHALEALGQAMAPDLPLTKILRLRGSAVSLSREAHKAQRKLDQRQKARQTSAPIQRPDAQAPKTQAPKTQTQAAQRQEVQQPATPTETPESTPHHPQIDKTLTVFEASRQAANAQAKTWTQGYQQRQAAKRIADNLKKNHAAHQATLHQPSVSTQAAIPAA